MAYPRKIDTQWSVDAFFIDGAIWEGGGCAQNR